VKEIKCLPGLSTIAYYHITKKIQHNTKLKNLDSGGDL